MIAQSVIDVLPDAQSVLGFMRRALLKVPGVDWITCTHIRNIAAHSDLPMATPDTVIHADDRDRLELRVRTTDTLFGSLLIQLANRDLFQPYRPYVANLACSAAIALENRRLAWLQRESNRALRQDHAQLESIVRDRTRQLSNEIEMRRGSEQALMDSEARYRATFEQAPVGISHTRIDGRFKRVNRHLCALLGYTAAELETKTFQEITHPDDLSPNLARLRQLLNGEEDLCAMEKRFLRKDGTVIWAKLTVSLQRTNDPHEPMHFTTIIEDITAARQADARIACLANHDALTQLANRRLLHQRMDAAVARACEGGARPAVLFMNLDRFKLVNNSLGDACGDLLLQTMAARLQAAVGPEKTVARHGSDEFVVLFDDMENEGTLCKIAQTVLATVNTPVLLDGHAVSVSASIGLSLYPQDGDVRDTLLRHANLAMHQAKENGAGCVRHFHTDMNARVYNRLLVENALRQALANGELFLHYQPRVQANNHAIIGLEALLRWRHPQRGVVPPGEFIPLAEEIGLITSLGEWVLHTAARQGVAWQQAGWPPLTIAVNLSARQLLESDIVSTIRRALTDTGLPPECLELEITESVLLKDMHLALAVLKQIHDLGVKLAIDDFGTGYSSLSYLKHLPVDVLKIDQSFVAGLPGNPDDMAIVNATITLAHKLEMQVVAEGVETDLQMACLTAQGCDQLQGFFFSQPLPAPQLAAQLQQSGYRLQASGPLGA